MASALERLDDILSFLGGGDTPTKLKIIMGGMEFGRFQSNEDVSNRIVEEFVRRGHTELDTAHVYTKGKSEEFIGRMPRFQDGSIKVATKVNPRHSNCPLTREGITRSMNISFERLRTGKVDLFYLHQPDHETPIEESLEAINELYRQGKFDRFGLSNYASWQVAEIVHICRANGYVEPTVFQGLYNPVTRNVEKELLPCLRRFGISFYAYNMLAGGLLTGKHSYEQQQNNSIQEGRFQGKMYVDRYWKKEYFDTVDLVKAAVQAAYRDSVSLAEASLRYMANHTMLKPEYGDGLILGAGTYRHFVANLESCGKGPLDQRVVDAFDQGWELCRKDAFKYYR